MTDGSDGVTEVSVTSTIFFNCTQCGKSMSIEPAGQGCVVPCPDCQTSVEVPPADQAPELMSKRLGELSEKLAEVMQAVVDRIVLQIEEGLAPDRAAKE